MSILIGFGYKARTGKDTAIQSLISEYGNLMCRRFAFADELKRMAGLVPGKDLTAEERQKCQVLGMAMRDRDQNFWIKQVQVIIAHTNPHVALIGDVRFFNEFAWVKGSGGKLVKMVRTDGFSLGGKLGNHISEQELDKIPDSAWDKVIYAGSREEVIQKTLQWFRAEIYPSLEMAGLTRESFLPSGGSDAAKFSHISPQSNSQPDEKR